MEQRRNEDVPAKGAIICDSIGMSRCQCGCSATSIVLTGVTNSGERRVAAMLTQAEDTMIEMLESITSEIKRLRGTMQ